MNFFSFLFKKKFPGARTRSELLSGPLTLTRLIWHLLAVLVLLLAYVLLIKLNDRLLITIPASGGSVTEGVIGSPRFLNPVLAATDTDTALTSLIYAGLIKEYGDGSIAPELASEYHISPDGRTYTFLLRDKIFFQDHTPVSSSDVAFTIEKLQDATINPRTAGFWQTVSVSTPDEKTVIVTLPAPDDNFLYRMTFGIMPFELWHGIEGDAFAETSINLAPIGAGAFKIKRIDRDESGAPKRVTLTRNRLYPLGAPLLKEIDIAVFSNQESLLSAIKNGAIDITFDLDPGLLVEGTLPSNVQTIAIPTVTSMELFIHSGSSALANPALLALLNRYVDKTAIIDTVENGYGIPRGIQEQGEDTVLPTLEDTERMLGSIGYTLRDGILSKNGTPIALAIATKSNSKYIETGRILSGQLAALGVISDVQAFDLGTFQSELAAETFPLVLTDSDTDLSENYSVGIPLYTTAVVAVAKEGVRGFLQSALNSPRLRYATVPKWHVRTDHLYPFLAKLLNLQERI